MKTDFEAISTVTTPASKYFNSTSPRDRVGSILKEALLTAEIPFINKKNFNRPILLITNTAP